MADIKNVLLVSIDCLRYDKFKEAIAEGLVPTLASLSEAGTEFKSTYTVANTTDPSLTSFMTSRYPFDHGVVENGWGLEKDVPVAAERFQEAGFDTFGVVSVDHLSHEHSNLGRGFQQYFDGQVYDRLYPFLSRIYDTKTFNTVFGAIKDLGVRGYTIKRLLRSMGLINLHCRPASSVTKDATEGLDTADTPFFGWIHYFDMHEPRNAPQKFRQDHDTYTAAMIHVDRQVEALLSELKKRGIREETVIVLTGDHGEMLGEHGYTGHGRTLYDTELHVPLVFTHDSLKAQSIDTQVRTIDILPSLLDLVDAESLDADGKSVFDEEAIETDQPLFAMAYPTFANSVCIRQDSWKLIRHRETNEEEMYNLADDPNEQTNIIGSSPESYKELTTSLEEWLGSFDEIDQQAISRETEQMLEDLGYME